MEPTDESTAGLGGRLTLLEPDDLDDAQRVLWEQVLQTRGGAAELAGYVAVLPDGRVIGPFNALLHAPRVAGPLFGWTQAIAQIDTTPEVRETVILTVAAHWGASYALYAHTAVARQTALSARAVTALRRGRPPSGSNPDLILAHRLTKALIEDRAVPEELYRDAAATFGVETLVTLVNLIGQYANTCMILTCFAVPAPTPGH